MPFLKLCNNSNTTIPPQVIDGMRFAQASVEFASLGIIAGRIGFDMPKYHLFALSIELGFKSLALRSGANLKDCQKVNHRISHMIDLIESHGVKVPESLKIRLYNDHWFQSFLLISRYPTYINPAIKYITIY